MIEKNKEKMKTLRLPGALRAYMSSIELNDLGKMTNDEFLAFLLDTEMEDRESRKVDRLRKKANFKLLANIAEIDTSGNRGISKQDVTRISELSWISKASNIILTGATGTGKTFIANAFGQKAISAGHGVMYFPIGKLFRRIKEADYENSVTRILRQMEKTPLLILDDFGLEPFESNKCKILFEIIDDRYLKGSTILATQIPTTLWPKLFEDKTLGDAIIDRLIHNAKTIDLKKEAKSRRAKKD